MLLLISPKILKVGQFPGEKAPSSCVLTAIRGGSCGGGGVGWRWDVCPQGSSGWGQVDRQEDTALPAWGWHDSRHAGSAPAEKCGIRCHRVFLFQHKLEWQLTQLSPSTCRVESPSSHSALNTQKCTDLATLCSRSRSDNFTRDDHAWYLSRLSPYFFLQTCSQLVSSLLEYTARAEP